MPGSLAERFGLELDDEIIAIDGIKADYKTAEIKLSELKPGEEVRLTVFHNKVIKNVTLRQNEKDIQNYRIEKEKNPDALQKSIYEKWLGIKW